MATRGRERSDPVETLKCEMKGREKISNIVSGKYQTSSEAGMSNMPSLF